MKNEEKQLLSNAILGYLPYKLKVRYYDMEDGREEDDYIEGVSFYRTETTFDVDQYSIKAEGVKPYLRPIESMTEKEIEMYYRCMRKGTNDVIIPRHCDGNSIEAVVDGLYMRIFYDYLVSLNTIDFLNSIHIDYRGLIPMGLALPAQEGMYNTKTE